METRSKTNILTTEEKISVIRKMGESLSLTGDKLQDYIMTKWEDQLQDDKRERDRHEQEQIRERDRHEQEQIRERDRQHELEKLKIESEERIRLAEINKTTKVEQVNINETIKTKNYPLLKNLPKYDNNHELDEYIVNFEHIATQSNAPKNEWIAELQVRLTGELQSFLMTEDVKQKLTDYDYVKLLLLKHAGYHGEKYRDKWNNLAPENDNFRAFHSHLVRSLDNWVASSNTEKTFNGLKDLLCRNKLLLNMNSDAVKSVLMHNAKKCEDVLAQIDNIKSAGQLKITKKINTPPLVAGSAEHWGGQWGKRRSRSTEGRVIGPCFICGRMGHLQVNCRQNFDQGLRQTRPRDYRGRQSYRNDIQNRYIENTFPMPMQGTK
jgi:hypothetical protein